jgi:hypothetical protein
MLEHKGRRLKKLFAKHPATSPESESSQAPPHLPTKAQTVQRRNSFSATATGSVDSSDDRIRRRSSLAHNLIKKIPDIRKVSPASLYPSVSTRSDNRRNSTPITQLQPAYTGSTVRQSYLSMEEDPHLLEGQGHVKFSEDIADRNLGTSGPSPPIPQSSLGSSIIPTSVQPSNDTISEKDLEPVQNVQEDRKGSRSPYASIDSYDRKFSQPSTGRQANNVYVRAGRKATGWARPMPPEDDSDGENDEASKAREKQQNSVAFAQPELRRPTSGDTPYTNTASEYDPFRPSASDVGTVAADQTRSIKPKSLTSESTNASKPAHFRTPAADATSSVSQSFAPSSISDRTPRTEKSTDGGQSDFVRSEDAETVQHNSKPERGSVTSMHSKELSWQNLLRQSADNSQDSVQQGHPRDIPAPGTSHTTMPSNDGTLPSSLDDSPSVTRYNTAAKDARSAEWGASRVRTTSDSSSEDPLQLKSLLRPHVADRVVSSTTTGAIYGTSSDNSSEHSNGQTPVTPPSLATKPLPPLPNSVSTDGVYTLDRSADQKQEGAREYSIRDSSNPIDASSVVDLSNTTDTDVYTTIAPAVTHETIHPEYHHIREERVTREIHNYDIYHRILPIIETEILPARHFIHNAAGELVEIPASAIPGRTHSTQQWSVEEVAPTAPPTIPEHRQTRPFTARQWSGTDGDAKDYLDEKGIHRTETTWVHPPQLEDGGRLSGQTVPFHFDDMGGHFEEKSVRMPGGWQFDGASGNVTEKGASLEETTPLGRSASLAKAVSPEKRTSLEIRRKPIEGRESYVKTLEANIT